MTRTDTDRAMARTTPAERAVVLGGFAVAALFTAVAAVAGSSMETVTGLWFAAAVWAFFSSFALALRRGFRRGNWRAFRRYNPPDNDELVSWSTQTGEYAWMAVAEEHERLMRGD